MSFFSDRLVQHLDALDWGEYGLNKRFEAMPKEARLSEQYVYSLCRGEKSPKVETLEKIAAVPEIGLTLEQLKGWRAIDVYGKDAILKAAEELSPADFKSFLQSLPKGTLIELFGREYLEDLLKSLKELK